MYVVPDTTRLQQERDDRRAERVRTPEGRAARLAQTQGRVTAALARANRLLAPTRASSTGTRSATTTARAIVRATPDALAQYRAIVARGGVPRAVVAEYDHNGPQTRTLVRKYVG